ncbi:MAG TPA: tetratricopeptide repeat protein [Planctomycetota bacterium]|nr:tetratricopeptide repeat protein [Planctomycetota bacterium]
MSRRFPLSPVLAGLLTGLPTAQSPPRQANELDPLPVGVVLDVSATKLVKQRADVVYLRRGARNLALDIYQPPGAAPAQLRPAVVFLNAIGDRGNHPLRRWGIYSSWPRLVAAHGMCGVSMDADPDAVQDCLAAVFHFLVEHGKEYGIDADHLGVYAASANVTGASEYLLGPNVHTGIRAAALCYGSPPAQELRVDLPVLFIVAESDADRMREPLAELWRRVIERKAPWTLCYGSTLPDAFDAFADTPASRALVAQMISFWHNQLSPPAAGQPSPARTILSAMYADQPERAVASIDDYLKAHPKNPMAHSLRGSVLQRMGRTDDAIASFQRAIELGATEPDAYLGLADLRVRAHDYAAAEPLFRRGIELGADDGGVLAKLAHTQLLIDKNREAVANYERALAAGLPPWAQPPGVARYNLACGYVRLGRKDDAIRALGQAVEAGFKDKRQYETDDDLKPLRDDPRFQELLRGL